MDVCVCVRVCVCGGVSLFNLPPLLIHTPHARLQNAQSCACVMQRNLNPPHQQRRQTESTLSILFFLLLCLHSLTSLLPAFEIVFHTHTPSPPLSLCRCTEVRECVAGEYLLASSTATSDADCALCDTCGPDEYETVPCTIATNRRCVNACERDAGGWGKEANQMRNTHAHAHAHRLTNISPNTLFPVLHSPPPSPNHVQVLATRRLLSDSQWHIRGRAANGDHKSPVRRVRAVCRWPLHPRAVHAAEGHDVQRVPLVLAACRVRDAAVHTHEQPHV